MSGETVSFDTMLDALSDIERRTLLVALLKHDPQSDLPVVIGDGGDERDVVGESIGMHHIHLPKLAEHGLIEWDRENHEVHTGPAFGEIRPLLELLESHRDELPEGWI